MIYKIVLSLTTRTFSFPSRNFSIKTLKDLNLEKCGKLSLYSTVMQNSHIGASRWSRTPTREFCVGDTNMLVSKNAKICKFKTPTPIGNRWNIGRVGSPTQNSRVGHVHLIFLVSISFALGPVFQWNMSFTLFYAFQMKY